MENIKNIRITFLFIILLFSGTIISQNKITFKVDGTCEMCKNRIEETALEFDYVEAAKWNENSKEISLEIDGDRSNVDEVQRAIADIGHDTEKYKAPDEVYENLPMCCHYRDEDISDDHSDHVHGRVWETDFDGKKQYIEGVNIIWKGTTDGVVSGKQGTFVLPRTDNSDRVLISFVGYETKDVLVGDKNFVEVVFSQNKLLDEVIVSYRKESTSISFLKTLKTQDISEEELQKAACCNLSESFETTPSVEVSSTDAVSGTKQIEMLGLAGSYVQITRENMPETRGLSALYGLTYTPGSWIESIQLNMGTGSVINGFESITGQINTELKKPDSGEKLGLNAYANAMGRVEANANFRIELNENLSTAVLLHGNTRAIKWDKNNDGFLDSPFGDQIIVLNRWKYNGHDGWQGQFGIKGLSLNQKGGQVNYYEKNSDVFWNSSLKTDRIDSWLKVGKVIDDKSSFGIQISGILHNQESNFGPRIYNAKQSSLYSNFIYQNALNEKHEIKTGLSFMYDNYNEDFESSTYLRRENVVGAFTEYTYKGSEKFTGVLGLRVDNHNNFGVFVTPRLHLKYAVSDKSVFRLSMGRGQKTASIFAENIGAMASSRRFIINSTDSDNPYGLSPEVAWSYGLNYSKGIEINNRNLTLNVDYFFTNFENKIVVDYDSSPKELSFYNLDGRSFSHSIQLQADWEVIERFDVRLAYRFNEVKTDYKTEFMSKPLLSPHRAFVNLAYATNSKWKFDFTTSWQSSKRIPGTSSNPVEYRMPDYSPSFFIVNSQISKSWYSEKLELYIGVENLFDFKQSNPIISSDNPFGEYFDASMVWGPVFGRNIYTGIRYKI
ncbi:MAG: TonB-dependent receptor [Bacteroidota bacterium]